MLGMLVLMVAMQTGRAADPIVIASPADIPPLLPPPDATRWDPGPVVQAIRESRYAFSPADVYALVDLRAPERVVRAVCERAGEPFDATWRPLRDIAAEARRGQPVQRIEVDVDSFDRLFTTLQRLEAEVAAAGRAVRSPDPRGPAESERLYERRLRRHAIEQARAIGPAEGRLAATTFAVRLPVTVEPHDGCTRPVARVDASHLPFSTFRAGMGTLDRTNPVTLVTSSVDYARFDVNDGLSFEVVGRCGETASTAELELSRTHDGRWAGRGELE